MECGRVEVDRWADVGALLPLVLVATLAEDQQVFATPGKGWGFIDGEAGRGLEIAR